MDRRWDGDDGGDLDDRVDGGDDDDFDDDAATEPFPSHDLRNQAPAGAGIRPRPSPPNRVGGFHQGTIGPFDVSCQFDRGETEGSERRIDT